MLGRISNGRLSKARLGMSYPLTLRRARKSFLPTIDRIVARIEARPTHHLVWRWDAWFGGGMGAGSFSISALYVFGSFARGAPLCADLDLILAVTCDAGAIPPERLIASKVKGRLPDVDMAIVMAESLPAKLERFTESKLVWSPTARDWRANVAAIAVDPRVGHFARKTDVFPLSLKQIAFYRLEHAEHVADRIAAGELVSTWQPLEAITPEPEGWPPELQRILEKRTLRLGSESTKVLPYVLQYMASRLDTPIGLRWGTERACVHVNDLFAHIGRPALHVGKLDRIDVSVLILAPHLRPRLPQGLWILERGEKHESVQAISTLRAWTEGEGGVPFLCDYFDEEHYYVSRAGIELFASKRKALAFIRRTSDGSDEDKRVPLELAGAELLRWVAKAGVVVVGEHELRVVGDSLDFERSLRALLSKNTPRRVR